MTRKSFIVSRVKSYNQKLAATSHEDKAGVSLRVPHRSLVVGSAIPPSFLFPGYKLHLEQCFSEWCVSIRCNAVLSSALLSVSVCGTVWSVCFSKTAKLSESHWGCWC